jgi:hypothetical protein
MGVPEVAAADTEAGVAEVTEVARVAAAVMRRAGSSLDRREDFEQS